MKRLGTRLFAWASVLDDQARDQALAASRLPFVHPHIALMPDAHLGKGATVGSVIPTLGAIIPAAVGVDIGCGMIAVRTPLTVADLPADRTSVREAIEAAVPTSAGSYNTQIAHVHTQERITELEAEAEKARFDPEDYAANWRLQVGTLGSGNHFIELSADELGRVWAFLHSGSRGVGNKIALHHIAVARRLATQWWIDLPDPDLAYLVERTDEFWAYIRHLRWAQRFALLNREEMMDRVLACVAGWLGVDRLDRLEEVNCHHNYTESERHFGKQVWLSRKGAIDASEGVAGLIPGSMGTASYVVTGRGNPMALRSAPHGAGRQLSRSQARKRFTADDLERAMGGIEYRHTPAFIDEIPAAYKDIDQVMADAADLVEVRHVLRQLVNVKGD
ncbi:RtcB family protein [Propionicicella superfundia]|uniref:RtcB family protein n=1 Tax=Propionicicella superfundia TaxID=348582 RepID=UPI00040B2D89|nr:RtcB family protein [Propionicicella superfundia]